VKIDIETSLEIIVERTKKKREKYNTVKHSLKDNNRDNKKRNSTKSPCALCLISSLAARNLHPPW
jgi:hypothetical protein